MVIIINPQYKYLLDHIKQLPDSFEKEGVVVYVSRNILKRMTIGDVDVVVKSFRKPHIVNRIVYSFFRKSKAIRSYYYSTEIMKHGFCIPTPIAVVERYKFKLLSDSYYICAYDNGETIRGLMDGPVSGNEDKLKAFAHYTERLHRSGILHLDYSPGNILIHHQDGEYSFSLVDVNRLRLVNVVDCEMAADNFRRLCNSREVLEYIIEQYATIRGWDVDKMKRLATWYSDRFFADFTYRRAAKKIHGQHIWWIILWFKLSRRLRRILPGKSMLHHWLYAKEKRIYHLFFSLYDYRHVFSSEY